MKRTIEYRPWAFGWWITGFVAVVTASHWNLGPVSETWQLGWRPTYARARKLAIRWIEAQEPDSSAEPPKPEWNPRLFAHPPELQPDLVDFAEFWGVEPADLAGLQARINDTLSKLAHIEAGGFPPISISPSNPNTIEGHIHG